MNFFLRYGYVRRPEGVLIPDGLKVSKSQMESRLYSLRADLVNGVTTEAVARWLTNNADSWICVRETVDGENPHVHVRFYSSEPKLKNLRNRVVRQLGCVGNGSYSLTEADDDEKLIRYVCKGAGKDQLPEVVSRQGLEWTDEYIEQQHRAYWDQNESIALSRKTRKRAREQGAMVDVLEGRVKAANVRASDRGAVARIVVAYYADVGKPFDQMMIKRWVNVIQARMGDENIFDSIANLVATSF